MVTFNVFFGYNYFLMIHFSVLLSKSQNVHKASSSTNMTYYQTRRDHDNAPSNFAGNDSHFFKNIFDKTLCDKKLVRILTSLSFSLSLSHFYLKILMVLKKHRLDWLAAACLIWIVLCIFIYLRIWKTCDFVCFYFTKLAFHLHVKLTRDF